MRNSTTYWALCAALLFFGFQAKSQVDSVLKTSQLPTAEIVVNYDWSSLNIMKEDSINELSNLAVDISELLRKQGITVQQSGAPGMLRLVRASGLPAEYTQFYWNGFALNSVTHGLIDFSLLPAFIFDNLQIGTSSLAGSVGSGSGGVALFSANALPSSHKAELAFYSDADQMQNYHTGISLKGNIKKINYNFKYYQTSESNEFTFKDPWKEDNLEWQHHNNHRSRHLLLEMGHKRKKSEFKLASWLSGRTLNLPNQLGFYGQSDANQADSAMRIVGSYQLSLGNWKLFSSISRFSEIQMYRSHKLSEGNYFVDSRHKSINNSINVLLKNENNKFLKEIQIQPFLTSVHSNDYVSGSQSEMGFFSAIRYRLRYNRFASGIQLRQEFSNLGKPITALSFVQNIRTNKILGFISEFEMSISSMHRRPTLNERFWTPVMNQTIKPENGWQSGVCWKLNKVSEKHSINIASTINFFELRDKIVWVNENAIWFARNVYYAKGFNWSLNVEHERKIKNVILTTGLRLTKTSAKYAIADEWIRAPYTPEWSAALNLMVHYKNWSIAGSTGYSSAQTVDFTDSPWASIPDQFRQDIRLNCQVLKSQNKVELFLAVDNISDERYQSVYAMPMPGRICRLGVSLRHNHK